ncbi:hypothetical protein AC1031_015696 [Aphanomyces cochlioides]|nr:hypothetical protein AC1031_015696 [Aphanomyces cochlioides]
MSEGKRNEVFRFKASTDVDLLREVMRAQPFAADYGQTGRRWEELSGSMFEDLVVNFKKDTLNSLRASGTDEEYNEREQLLHDIVDLMDVTNNEKQEKKSSKLAKMKKREDDCDDVCRLGMVAIQRKRESLGDDCDKLRQQPQSGPKSQMKQCSF